MRHAILIRDKRSRTDVAATLVEGLDASDLAAAEGDWGPVRHAAAERLKRTGMHPRDVARALQHAHWDWTAKAPLLAELGCRCVGIERDRRWQGLALLDAGSKLSMLPPDRGKPLIYVDYLESAPWNLPDYVDEPQYGLIGLRLVEYAVRFSMQEGFHGRVGLLALPQAEPFYEQGCGMTRVADGRMHGLEWFEFSRKQAKQFLKGESP